MPVNKSGQGVQFLRALFPLAPMAPRTNTSFKRNKTSSHKTSQMSALCKKPLSKLKILLPQQLQPELAILPPPVTLTIISCPKRSSAVSAAYHFSSCISFVHFSRLPVLWHSNRRFSRVLFSLETNLHRASRCGEFPEGPDHAVAPGTREGGTISETPLHRHELKSCNHFIGALTTLNKFFLTSVLVFGFFFF